MIQMKSPKATATIFVLVTFLLTILVKAYQAAFHTKWGTPSGDMWMLLLMWSPAAGAFLVCLWTKRSIRTLAWGWGPAKYHLAAYLIPLLYGLVTFGLIWGLGFGKFGDPSFCKQTAIDIGMPNHPIIGMIVFVLFMATVGIIRAVSFALGEEIGWRGFLVPELAKFMSYRKLALISGLIWAVWHMPTWFVLGSPLGPEVPLWYVITTFTVSVVSASFLFAWIRLRSGSIWPAALIHGSHNLFINGIFDPLTTQHKPISKFAVGETGFVLSLVMSALLIFLWFKSRDYKFT